MGSGRATVVYVSFRTAALDLTWVPADERVVIVHNDDSLDPSSLTRSGVLHVHSDGNVGFGAGVNASLPYVETPRLVMVNPDASLTRAHWDALTGATPDEIVTVPIVDTDGAPTSVVSRYPTPGSLALTAWRAGRLLPRGTAARRQLARLLGRWGAELETLQRVDAGAWPLREYWASGAVLSVDRDRFAAIGGFDTGYFLYLEDVDLCRRLASHYPQMRARLATTEPAVHAVSFSSRGARRPTDAHYLRSARRYARSNDGAAWRLCDVALAPRERWLTR